MAFPAVGSAVDTDFATSVTTMAVNLASAIFYDQFTGADDTAISAHTPNRGTSWTQVINNASNLAIGSNAVNGNNATGGLGEGALYSADVTYPSANYAVHCTITTADSGDDPCWLAVRIQNATNMYAVRFNNDDCQLYKCVAGSWSTVGAAGAGVVDGSVVTLKISGTTLSFIDDGSTILSQTVSDHSGAGKAGIGMGDVTGVGDDDMSGQIMDNFIVTPIGELALAFVSVRNSGTWTVPTNWVEFDAQIGGGSVGETTLFYKILDGTEKATATWTAGTGTTAAWQTRLITAWHGTTAPESDTASGDATNANPPTLSPSWGSADTLWIAVAGNSATGETTGFTAAPTNYINLASNGASTGGSTCNIATATRENATATEDPGTFTPNSNRFWAAVTIAIRPVAAAGSAIKTINGLAKASVKTVNDLAIASVKTWDGLA